MVPYTGPAALPRGCRGWGASPPSRTQRPNPADYGETGGTHIGTARIYYNGTGSISANSIHDAGPGASPGSNRFTGSGPAGQRPSTAARSKPRPSFRSGTAGTAKRGPARSAKRAELAHQQETPSMGRPGWILHRPQSEVRSRPGNGQLPGRARLSRRQADFCTLIVTSNVPAAGGACVAGDQASSTDWTSGLAVSRQRRHCRGRGLHLGILSAPHRATSDGLNKGAQQDDQGP